MAEPRDKGEFADYERGRREGGGNGPPKESAYEAGVRKGREEAQVEERFRKLETTVDALASLQLSQAIQSLQRRADEDNKILRGLRTDLEGVREGDLVEIRTELLQIREWRLTMETAAKTLAEHAEKVVKHAEDVEHQRVSKWTIALSALLVFASYVGILITTLAATHAI